jgi:hypothetical protein
LWRGVHEVDVVGDVDPVEGDVREQFGDAEGFQFVVVFVQQTAVGADGVDHSCHLNIF